MKTSTNGAAEFTLNYPWLDTKDNHPIKCCLCDGKYPAQDRFVFKINSQTYRICHCPTDDLMYISPQPGQKYFDSLYNHPSYFKGEDDMYGLAINDEKSTKIARIRLEEILKYKNKPNSILEVGCAYGHTLMAAKESGFKVTDGIEFSTGAVKACQQKGLNVSLHSQNAFTEVTSNKKQYDVIAMYSVLEHIQNPVAFLQEMQPLLAKKGIMVIRVPEMSTDGPWLSLVDHTWHLTRTSMKKLLRKVNLSIADIFPSGKYIGITHKGELSNMTIIARGKNGK